jgi:ABC-type multidrug transport system fused ATPase/permease subunit
MASDLSPRLATLKASVALHITMLRAMMVAPLMFFDQTPIGRILSRFSSDIDATDQKIPEIVSDGIWCLFEVTKLHLWHIIKALFTCTTWRGFQLTSF